MVGLCLLVALALPQGQADASLAADRTVLQVGDSLTLSITVRAPEVGPVDIDEPQLSGFDVVERRDRSQVSVGTGVRTTQRDLVLRARQEGDYSLGPIRIRIAGTALVTNAVRLTVTAAPQPGEDLSPRVLAMIETANPVGSDSGIGVEVSVLRFADSVRLGEQIDLVIVAWFPQDVRARLRAPPSLIPPDVRGAWGYSQAAPAGVVASREIGGRTYDLFVHHEIVFALTHGDLEVGPAKVTYSLPISGSFLSREVRHEAQSTPFLVGVMPIADTPPDRTVAGRSLTIALSASDTLLPIGDASRVSVTVSGLGNVALWPEPELRWPAGLQAYQERSAVSVVVQDGILGGSKQFDYLVVADSGGMHRLPAPRYEYFDLDAGEFVTVQAQPAVFETPESTRRAGPLRAAPPLMRDTWVLRVSRALRTVSLWVWVVVFALPPFGAALVEFRRRRHAGLREPIGQRRAPNALAQMEEDVRQALQRLVPGAVAGGEVKMANALVAAGVEPALAAHASRVRERLRQALYGPEPPADADELTEEAVAVLRALTGHRRHDSARRIATVLLIVLGTGASQAHGQSVERLWEAGATRAVAESLSARLREAPGDAVQAYNLSVAWEQLGEHARARAAWVAAARAAPHQPRIRRAGRRWADQRAAVLWVGPLAPVEAVAMAALLWVIGWALLSLTRRRWVGRLALAGAVALGAVAGVTEIRYRTPYALVVSDGTALREAPYGPAPSRGILEAADAVIVERADRDWRLVSVDAVRGWVHVSEVLEP